MLYKVLLKTNSVNKNYSNQKRNRIDKRLSLSTQEIERQQWPEIEKIKKENEELQVKIVDMKKKIVSLEKDEIDKRIKSISDKLSDIRKSKNNLNGGSHSRK